MSEAVRLKAKTRQVYNAALKARGSLTLWLERDMQWLADPTCQSGRQRTFSDAAIQFCLSVKCLFWLGPAPKFGHCRKPAAASWPGLARSQLQHRVSTPARPQGATALPAQSHSAGSAGHLDHRQQCGRCAHAAHAARVARADIE